jgi:hypothetical protein
MREGQSSFLWNKKEGQILKISRLYARIREVMKQNDDASDYQVKWALRVERDETLYSITFGLKSGMISTSSLDFSSNDFHSKHEGL